jgi:hypothetical protein
MVLEISFLVSKLAPVSSSIMSSFRALLSIDDGGWPYCIHLHCLNVIENHGPSFLVYCAKRHDMFGNAGA